MNPRITLAHVLIVMLICFSAGIVLLLKLFPALPPSPFGLVFLIIVGVLGYFYSTWYVNRARMSRFAGREVMGPQEIYRRYFHNSGLREEVFVNQWREVARSLELPAGLLRPSDRFDTELKPLTGWPLYDDQIEHLFVWAQRKVGSGAGMTLSQVQSLGDFITLTVRAEVESPNSSSDKHS
jgi:hypothetical protein